jgi:hypothetical protein
MRVNIKWVWRQHLINNPVSVELGEILDKLIEFGTKKRYQSAGEVLQELAVKLAVLIPPKPQITDYNSRNGFGSFSS